MVYGATVWDSKQCIATAGVDGRLPAMECQRATTQHACDHGEGRHTHRQPPSDHEEHRAPQVDARPRGAHVRGVAG